MKTFITIKSDIDNIPVVESFVDELSAKHNIKEEIYGNIMVAVVEAATNAIKHGNKLDPSTYVYIDSKIIDENLVISIKDEGLGFDYNSVADPTLPDNIEKLSGRGVYIMRTLADKIEFSEGGTLVTLYFNLIK